MFAIEELTYTKVSSVPLGHLILCGSYVGTGPARPELAIRVEVPHESGMDSNGVLFLRLVTHWGDVGAGAYGQFGEHLCLDLGVPRFAINEDLIDAAIPRRSYDPRPGMLALCGRELLVLASFGTYGHQRAWWNVASGKQHNCREHLVLERWCVGLTDLNEKFIPQLRYPEDFKRDAPPA